MFSLAAVVSAIVYLLEYRLLRWRLSDKEVEGDRIWKNLRRFSGWMCAGSIVGAVNFALLMLGRNTEYESRAPGITRRRSFELRASALRFFFQRIRLFVYRVPAVRHLLLEHGAAARVGPRLAQLLQHRPRP